MEVEPWVDNKTGVAVVMANHYLGLGMARAMAVMSLLHCNPFLVVLDRYYYDHHRHGDLDHVRAYGNVAVVVDR